MVRSIPGRNDPTNTSTSVRHPAPQAMPIVVHARPAGRPVCTRGLRRAARVWTTDGADHGQLDALAEPESHALQVSSFEDVDAADREREIAVSHKFLVDAVANYWDRDWRREHRGSGQTPEQLLAGAPWPPRTLRRHRTDLSRPPPPQPRASEARSPTCADHEGQS